MEDKITITVRREELEWAISNVYCEEDEARRGKARKKVRAAIAEAEKEKP